MPHPRALRRMRTLPAPIPPLRWSAPAAVLAAAAAAAEEVRRVTRPRSFERSRSMPSSSCPRPNATAVASDVSRSLAFASQAPRPRPREGMQPAVVQEGRTKGARQEQRHRHWLWRIPTPPGPNRSVSNVRIARTCFAPTAMPTFTRRCTIVLAVFVPPGSGGGRPAKCSSNLSIVMKS